MIRTLARHAAVVPATAVGAVLFGLLAHQQVTVNNRQPVVRQDLTLLRDGINGEIDLLQRQLSEELASGQVSQEQIARIQVQIRTLEMLVTTTTRSTTTSGATTTTRPATTTTSRQPATTSTSRCRVIRPVC